MVEYVADVNMISEARNNWCQTQAAYRNLPLFYHFRNNQFTSLCRSTYADYYKGDLGNSTPDDIKQSSQQIARERFPSPLAPRP